MSLIMQFVLEQIGFLCYREREGCKARNNIVYFYTSENIENLPRADAL